MVKLIPLFALAADTPDLSDRLDLLLAELNQVQVDEDISFTRDEILRPRDVSYRALHEDGDAFSQVVEAQASILEAEPFAALRNAALRAYLVTQGSVADDLGRALGDLGVVLPGSLVVGERVFWSDPDRGACSGWYVFVSSSTGTAPNLDAEITLTNGLGCMVEASVFELMRSLQ